MVGHWHISYDPNTSVGTLGSSRNCLFSLFSHFLALSGNMLYTPMVSLARNEFFVFHGIWGMFWRWWGIDTLVMILIHKLVPLDPPEKAYLNMLYIPMRSLGRNEFFVFPGIWGLFWRWWGIDTLVMILIHKLVPLDPPENAYFRCFCTFWLFLEICYISQCAHSVVRSFSYFPGFGACFGDGGALTH